MIEILRDIGLCSLLLFLTSFEECQAKEVKRPEAEVPRVVVAEQPAVEKVLKVSRFNTEWDFEFKKATERYLPGYSYTLLKAQCYQESLLNPLAVSPVGAEGLCQFMPFTWKEVSKSLKFPEGSSAFAPELAIEAAAYYDAKLRHQWRWPRPEFDRMNLTLASYNAGLGNILKAQKKCDGLSLYEEIIRCLPDVTGHHSKETITYVRRIRKFEREMNLLQ